MVKLVPADGVESTESEIVMDCGRLLGGGIVKAVVSTLDVSLEVSVFTAQAAAMNATAVMYADRTIVF